MIILPSQNKYDVVLHFNASGISATTTGSISSSSQTTTLTMADASSYRVNQGVYVAGAGVAGANLITWITAISGNSVTVNDAASTTVSGAVVQHDDTRAINAAIAAAFNDGGGMVWFPCGYYRCNGPFDATTFGVLTVPQNISYVGVPTRVFLRGEARANLSANAATVSGGVCLDFTNTATPSGGQIGNAAMLSPAPYIQASNPGYLTQFNNVDLGFDEIYFLAPADPRVHGLMLSNALRANIYEGVAVIAQNPTAASAPTHSTVGIWMPQTLDNVLLRCGGQISCFDRGLIPGEHAHLEGPYITGCNKAIEFQQSQHTITGWATLETNAQLAGVQASVANQIPIDLFFGCEVFTSGTPAWALRGTYDLIDTGNSGAGWLRGFLDYEILITNTGVYSPINLQGASNLTTRSI